MTGAFYPWGGRFMEGDPKSCVAAVTLSEEFELPADRVALWGSMKTENLGVEKVIANVVSNPNIRFLIVCGTEVRGHRSGDAIVSLHRNGVDGNNRVIGASSAIPFIENLPGSAVERFRSQVRVVDLIGVSDIGRIAEAISSCEEGNPGPYGEPMLVEHIAKDKVVDAFHGEYALHSGIDLDMYGVVSDAPEGI
jgi:tetrahydromethanopterin S-methyltransferase subunit A